MPLLFARLYQHSHFCFRFQSLSNGFVLCQIDLKGLPATFRAVASISRMGQHFLHTGVICFYSKSDKSRRKAKGNDELTGICVVHSLPPFWNLRSDFKMVA